MAYTLLKEEWSHIRAMLPSDLEASARQQGACRRNRGGLADAETLLRVLLMHAGGGLSLEQTVLRARENGIAEVSPVALHKRLQACEKWLGELTRGMLSSLPLGLAPVLPVSRTVRILDATCVQRPGSSGTDWRLHYSLKLPELVCDFFEVTDEHGGESFKRLPTVAGQIILADRAYSRPPGIACLLEAKADVVVRLLPSNVPLQRKNGSEFDLLKALRSLQGHQPGEWLVSFKHGHRSYAMRLCAVRKTQMASERERKKRKYEAARKGAAIAESTLELTQYICVLSSLTSSQISAAEILDLYRCRWQVELAFKRLKSLLEAGQLPKKDPRTCRAWMQAKVLASLIIDRLILDCELFSPWGYRL